MKGRRKVKVGIVVSDRMDKTIVVKCEKVLRHPRYHRVIKKFRKFYVHDKDKKAKVGDEVKIMEIRPLSRPKRWRLVEVLK